MLPLMCLGESTHWPGRSPSMQASSPYWWAVSKRRKHSTETATCRPELPHALLLPKHVLPQQGPEWRVASTSAPAEVRPGIRPNILPQKTYWKAQICHR